jgi:hypothetical protein
VGGVGGDRLGACGARGRGARVLGDCDAREGNRGEEGDMHVELSLSDVVGERRFVTVVIEKERSILRAPKREMGRSENTVSSESGYGREKRLTRQIDGGTAKL